MFASFRGAYLHPKLVLTSTPQEGTLHALWCDQRNASPPSSWQRLSSCTPAETKRLLQGWSWFLFIALKTYRYLTCWCSWWCGPGPSSGRCRAPQRRCVWFQVGCPRVPPPPRIPDGDVCHCWRLRTWGETLTPEWYVAQRCACESSVVWHFQLMTIKQIEWFPWIATEHQSLFSNLQLVSTLGK